MASSAEPTADEVGYAFPALSEASAPDTRTRLLLTALDVFASRGYEGTSIREIERFAGVNRGLVAYHFGSKLALWRETVNWLMDRFHEEFVPHQEVFRHLSPAERERTMLGIFVRFCSKYPQFFRLLIIEGDHVSERTEWLVSEHLVPIKAFFDRLSGRLVHDDAPSESVWYFGFVGVAATLFAVSTLSEMMFGVDGTDPDTFDTAVSVATQVGLALPNLTEAARRRDLPAAPSA
ncbi:MAG TPA: TetR/AcrR family transcriptional regulator [Acidimicrobiales bacterium]|nr:TetR/AcrR family transcriptional regulator [Acidimicrobiales bacterium]